MPVVATIYGQSRGVQFQLDISGPGILGCVERTVDIDVYCPCQRNRYQCAVLGLTELQ